MMKNFKKIHKYHHKKIKKLFTNRKKCGIICLYDVNSVIGYEAAGAKTAPQAAIHPPTAE